MFHRFFFFNLDIFFYAFHKIKIDKVAPSIKSYIKIKISKKKKLRPGKPIIMQRIAMHLKIFILFFKIKESPKTIKNKIARLNPN